MKKQCCRLIPKLALVALAIFGAFACNKPETNNEPVSKECAALENKDACTANDNKCKWYEHRTEADKGTCDAATITLTKCELVSPKACDAKGYLPNNKVCGLLKKTPTSTDDDKACFELQATCDAITVEAVCKAVKVLMDGGSCFWNGTACEKPKYANCSDVTNATECATSGLVNVTNAPFGCFHDSTVCKKRVATCSALAIADFAMANKAVDVLPATGKCFLPTKVGVTFARDFAAKCGDFNNSGATALDADVEVADCTTDTNNTAREVCFVAKAGVGICVKQQASCMDFNDVATTFLDTKFSDADCVTVNLAAGSTDECFYSLNKTACRKKLASCADIETARGAGTLHIDDCVDGNLTKGITEECHKNAADDYCFTKGDCAALDAGIVAGHLVKAECIDANLHSTAVTAGESCFAAVGADRCFKKPADCAALQVTITGSVGVLTIADCLDANVTAPEVGHVCGDIGGGVCARTP